MTISQCTDLRKSNVNMCSPPSGVQFLVVTMGCSNSPVFLQATVMMRDGDEVSFDTDVMCGDLGVVSSILSSPSPFSISSPPSTHLETITYTSIL